jgi:YVTN family beta-propeller protein
MKKLVLCSVLLLLLGIVVLVELPAHAVGKPTTSVSGVVRLQDGRAVGGAWVRVQTTPNLTYSASDGSFTLGGLTEGVPITVTAWYTDQKVSWAYVTPPINNVVLTLRPYDTRDNTAYVWNTSFADPANPTLGCGHCMSPSFQEWQHTAHAKSGTNVRFFSLYNGTDITGTGVISPGYKLDFPGTVGNCATCHAPGTAYDAPFTTDMNALTGVNREGVFCEFCHKVGAVYLNPATNRPYNNAPGVISMRLYRPYGSDQIFFGSLDDVTRRVSYLPVERKSQFCAPCHQFSFWGTPIYQSYREWQESAYPSEGIECQTCHMPPGTSPTFVLPEKGGLSRDPNRMASHLDLGLKDTTFMQSTVAMTLTAQPANNAAQVNVTLNNVNAGHHVPTDSPLRNMLLVITATDGQGQPLALQSGGTVPAWGGNYVGKPGKGYAKILRDVISGESPVVNYWKQTLIVSDNRLPARGIDTSSYTFALPPGSSPTHITATLIFRRAFQSVEQARGWQSSDIVMAQASATLTAASRTGTGTYKPANIRKQKPVASPQAHAAPAPQSATNNPRSSAIRNSTSAVKRSSSAIAITADGSMLLVVNPDSNTLSLVDPISRTVLSEISVGVDPRTVAVDDTGARAYVANRGSNSVSVVDLATRARIAQVTVGNQPYGIVVSPGGDKIYLAEQGANQVRVLNPSTFATLSVVPVADRPSGLAISDNGQTLYVTHLLTNTITIIGSADFYRIFLPMIFKDTLTAAPIRVQPFTSILKPRISSIQLWPDSNLVQSIVFSPDRLRAYIPHTRSNTSNRALTFDTTVFPLVSFIDLTTQQHLIGQQLDLGTLDPPGVGLPFDAAVMPDNNQLWVVNAGSNDLSVLDLVNRRLAAHIQVGDNPRGIVLSPDGNTAYVNNTLAGTVSVLDTRTYTVTATITTTQIPLPPALLRGKQLFNSSDRSDLARAQWISCNTCHFEGEHDARTWFFGFAGPRNTTSLFGMIQTYPLRWSAEWNESADSEFAIRKENFGTGLITGDMNCLLSPPDCVSQPPNQGRSYNLDTLALFMDGLEAPRSPYPMNAAAQRGQAIFNRPSLGCITCHPSPLYTDLRKHNVGTSTADEKIGPSFDTPTLRGLYSSAPYFHDGSALTLRAALTRATTGNEHNVTGALTEAELQDLIAFLLALPFE